jgi:hypothetical protein
MIYKDTGAFIARRRIRSIAIPFFLVVFAPAVAKAGPPTQLYGKSISVKWDEDKHNKYVSGEESDVTVNRAYGIYISSQGRMFVRSANIVQGGGSYKRPGNMNKSGIAAAQSVSPDGTVIKTRNFPVSHQNGSFTIDRWSVSPHSTAAYAALRSTSTKVSEPALLT